MGPPIVVVDAGALNLYFDSVDLQLQVISVTRQTGPAQDEPERVKLRDTPVIFHDWSGGGGISQSIDAIPNGYGYAQNLVTRFPGALISSGALTEVAFVIPSVTLGEITGSFEQDGTLYFLAGRYVVPIANGTDPGPITSLGNGHDFGPNVTAVSAVEFANAVYVGTQGAGGTLWAKPSTAGWTNVDLTTGAATLVRRTLLVTAFWSVDDPSTGTYAGYYLLAGLDADDPRVLRYVAADPLVPGNWGPRVPILNRTYPINSLVASNRHIWACTAATVADIDQRNEPLPLNLDYFRWPYDTTLNGAQSLFHNGWLYVTHSRGLDRTYVGDDSHRRDDTPGWCDWRQGVSAETPVVPRRWANLIALDGYIVAPVWNGSDSYINFGRDRSEINRPGPGPLAWYLGEYYLPGERITHIRVTSPTGVNPRLWICSVDRVGATRVRWASLPYAGSPLEEIFTNLDDNGAYIGTHRFAPLGTMYQSKIDLQDQSARKIPDRYDVRADRLSNATTVALAANAEDGPWVPQGTISTSPRGSALPTDPLTIGHNIGLRYDLAGTGTLPAVVREVRLRTRIRVEQAPTRHYVCLIGPVQQQRNSAWDDSDVQRRVEKLLALPTQAALSMRDELGEPRRVVVEEGITISREKVPNTTVDRVATRGPDAYEERLIATFDVSILPTSLQELSLDQTVTPTAVPQPPFWDDGSLWEP